MSDHIEFDDKWEGELLKTLDQRIKEKEERAEKRRKLDTIKKEKKQEETKRIEKERAEWPHTWPYPYPKHAMEVFIGFIKEMIDAHVENGHREATFGFDLIYRFGGCNFISTHQYCGATEINWNDEMKEYIMDYFRHSGSITVTVDSENKDKLKYVISN